MIKLLRQATNEHSPSLPPEIGTPFKRAQQRCQHYYNVDNTRIERTHAGARKVVELP